MEVFADVPQLQSLELMSNELVRNLAPLTRCRQLRTLQLTFCPDLRDLSPLADMTVAELALHNMHADPGTLRGANLHTLSIRDRSLNRSLHPLPADLPLRELTVDNRPPNRSLLGIERWQMLEHVGVFGVPNHEEVTALASLPRLRRLVVTGIESAQDVRRLEGLTSLRRLDLIGLDGLSAGERDTVVAVLRGLACEVFLDGEPLGDDG